MARNNSLTRVLPFYYLHILDNNTNVTRLEVGPQTLLIKEHERAVLGPEKMLVIPPRHYCFVNNPVVRNGKGEVVLDKFGQAKLRHGEQELREDVPDPFPLYPGENIQGEISPFKVVAHNMALKLRAVRDFVATETDGEESRVVKRKAGDEWLFHGPATYKPRVEVQVVETRNAVVVLPNQALKIEARLDCVDYKGVHRKAGEMWLVKEEGAYMPGVDETVLEVVKGSVLTEKKAYRVRALRTFEDEKGVNRRRGDEWLYTLRDSETLIPSVYEEIVQEVNITVLTSRQYCIVENCVDENGKPQLGRSKIVVGEAQFFPQPGEVVRPVQEIYVLGPEDALYVSALETFVENIGEREQPNFRQITRKAGSFWRVYGPSQYIPPLQVAVHRREKALIQLETWNLYVWNNETIKLVVFLAVLFLILSILIARF